MGRKSRTTRQKEALRDAISQTTTFFTAQDLQEKTGVGIATVYRYLKRAQERGEVNPYACGNHTIYSTQQQSHCHFICEKTGRVEHFVVDNLGFLEGKIPGKVTSFQIEVRGVCDECDE